MKVGTMLMVLFLVLVGLLAGSWVFGFKVINERRAALQVEIGEKQKALLDLQQATAGIADLGTKISDLQKAIAFFESKLPQEKDVDSVLNQVSEMASANSLQSRTFKTLKVDRTAAYCELPIQMDLSGDFDGFYTFLQQLERLERITRLTHMTLQKVADKEGHMQAQLTLSVFFEPDGGK